jgi:serine phosphatase RsbU (regulator of sigma subunit)
MHEALSSQLMRALLEFQGLNGFLDAVLSAACEALRAEGLVLYDYHEETGQFDLLYFREPPNESVARLHAQMPALDLARALRQPDPYRDGRAVLIPLCFKETLEAVLVAEHLTGELDEERRAVCRLLSRFLGLFLSSSRLAINRRSGMLHTSDLQRARQIQLTYLPSQPLVTDHYEVFGYNASSAIVGGDYFDFFQPAAGRLQCVLADACGHGLSAALIMSTFRGLLQARLGSGECTGLFTILNRHIYSESSFVQFLTAVFLDYDESSRRLGYFNAGHFDPLLVHADGSVTTLQGGGPPLGIVPDHEYVFRPAVAQPGDLLVLYTDGLVELQDGAQRSFGTAGILEAVIPGRALPLQALAEEVITAAVDRHSHGRPNDDLTLLLVRFGSQPND